MLKLFSLIEMILTPPLRARNAVRSTRDDESHTPFSDEYLSQSTGSLWRGVRVLRNWVWKMLRL